MITVQIVETDKSFNKKIISAIADLMDKLIQNKQRAISRDIKKLIPGWVKSQPEMIALSNDNSLGSLSAQLGLYYGTEKSTVYAIANAVAESFEIRTSKINKKTLEGGITLNFQPTHFQALLNLPEGHILFEGGELAWLQWLLLEGYSVIVVGYSFVVAPQGRSLGGYMRKPGTWRVPPEYAGTVDDNFVTRALSTPRVEKDIELVMKRHIK